MSLTHFLLSYLASAVLVGVLGAAVAVDRHRAEHVRTCAAWVALSCFAWPLMAVALAVIAATELRRRRDLAVRPSRTPVGASRRSW